MAEDTSTVPSINKTAFSCPHCNAYTTQHWSKLYTRPCSDEHKTPFIPDPEWKNCIMGDHDLDEKIKEGLLEWANNMIGGKPFFEELKDACYSRQLLYNLNISQCFNCNEMTIWVHDQLIWPNSKINIQPNQDLPQHIKSIFEEAREIVTSSPKGAAALLRLSIQYLCKELGESGKNIDEDIARLVAKGLNPLIQQALDVVRVVGNEAVHPGEIDLDDNRDTALQLFDLVNLIANQMISQPKQVKALYEKLPEGKLKGIEQRNIRAASGKDRS